MELSWAMRVPPSRLAESAYNSPYSKSGAPCCAGDPYAELRGRALSTMGYDAQTMIKRGVLWAEDQDPVIPVVRRYELEIRRQVRYRDALIVTTRPDRMEPTRYFGTTSLFSLKQQAIVAETRGNVTFIDAGTGRPVDIRGVSDGWSRVYEGYVKTVEAAQAFRQKWDEKKAAARTSKI
ncbi:hypothetical protein F4808DRAFT_452819 [Astrocystis sublimbata]|nr:hypothetical protein F4808DRAFT_452819 [Astrocystis sublimbata]